MFELLTVDDLLTAYKLTPTFVRKYGREMGGKGKPRRWPREAVDAFLRRHFLSELREADENRQVLDRLVSDIDAYLAGERSRSAPQEMRGRGGRAAEA